MGTESNFNEGQGDNQNIIREKIAHVEVQMKAKLEEIRTTFKHKGNKGSSVEEQFRQFLREYLPRRLDVGHGEIIDSKGMQSKQTDIIITTEDHPFTFSKDPGLFFIEGVCGAGEIKSILTSTELTKALENSCQFKKLEIEKGTNTMASTNPSDEMRFYRCPPWFLFAFESQITIEKIQDKINTFVNGNGVELNKFLDGIFILGKGCILNLFDGKGEFTVKKDAEPLSGLISCNSDEVLFHFLAWLYIVMPRVLRFSPILPLYIFKEIDMKRILSLS